MRRFVLMIAVATLLAFSTAGLAQEKTVKVAILNIQAAIAQSNDGQQAAKQLQDRFGPKRAELEKQQQEINALQEQLRNQQKTLSDDARNKLLRTIDDKTRAFNRTNEDATADFQQAEQDAINEIGRKMMGVISEHAQKNGFALVLDVSSPQTPVLYADSAIDITQTIMELYNQASAKPTASAAPKAPATPAAPAAPAAAPAAQSAAPAAAPASGQTKPASTP